MLSEIYLEKLMDDQDIVNQIAFIGLCLEELLIQDFLIDNACPFLDLDYRINSVILALGFA